MTWRDTAAVVRFWFNFSVENVAPDQRIIFNIVNLSKTRNLFTIGLTPIVRSTSRPKWQRIPQTYVYYYKVTCGWWTTTQYSPLIGPLQVPRPQQQLRPLIRLRLRHGRREIPVRPVLPLLLLKVPHRTADVLTFITGKYSTTTLASFKV